MRVAAGPSVMNVSFLSSPDLVTRRMTVSFWPMRMAVTSQNKETSEIGRKT